MTRKMWSYITGKRGKNRVRVYERRDVDCLFIEWFDNGHRWQRSLKSLVGEGVYSKKDAVRYAHQLAEKLATGSATAITDIMMQGSAAKGREDVFVERLILPEGELFSHQLPTKPLCGVYFLMDVHGRVLYVGQSTNILSRITTHLYQSGVIIARAAYQLFDEADLDRAEAFYIYRFQPPENVKYPRVNAEDKKLTWPEKEQAAAVGALPTPGDET